ncbi:MAG: hypothetical protein FWF05_05435 [Oscillospiraceae bacterium]|nr:hypothetical protein [Oscillospiraceae bacterium]
MASENTNPEPGAEVPASAKHKKNNHRGPFLLGLIIIGFSIFGAYKAAAWGFERVRALTDGSAYIEEYERFLRPFVVIDPSPFDDVSGADKTDLLDAAIGNLLTNSKKINVYEIFEGDVTGLLVPQKDVEEYFVALFGNEVALVHEEVVNSFHGVAYERRREAYIIPVTSNDPIYTPKIYEVRKQGSSIMLTVGYIGGTEWAQLEQGHYTAPEPDKFMKITLREDAGGYHIGSLQLTEALELARPGHYETQEEEEIETRTTEAATTQPEFVTDENGDVIETSASNAANVDSD